MGESLRILVTADPDVPVPPRFYGGIERVVQVLVNGLVARGHDVTLLAHRDSATAGALVPYPGLRSASWLDTVRNSWTLAREVRRLRPEIIHSFGRVAYLVPVMPLRIPTVMSYQRPITPRSVVWAHRLSQGTMSWTACSRPMIGAVDHLALWHVVPNAVPVGAYDYVASVGSDAPLVFLGRIERIKGPHLAIAVARAAGRRLIIAGNVPADPASQAYYRRDIAPHVDNRRVSYVGPVDDAAKNALLGTAAALLMPVLWDEPFGIVMIEALACGTPVVALARGAVPDVIESGVTGVVCENEREMVSAIAMLPSLDRRACRIAAERRFSGTALVDGYEAVYRSSLGARRAPSRPRRVGVVP